MSNENNEYQDFLLEDEDDDLDIDLDADVELGEESDLDTFFTEIESLKEQTTAEQNGDKVEIETTVQGFHYTGTPEEYDKIVSHAPSIEQNLSTYTNINEAVKEQVSYDTDRKITGEIFSLDFPDTLDTKLYVTRDYNVVMQINPNIQFEQCYYSIPNLVKFHDETLNKLLKRGKFSQLNTLNLSSINVNDTVKFLESYGKGM